MSLELIWISYSLSKWRFSFSLNGHIASHPPSYLCCLLSLQWLSHLNMWSNRFWAHFFLVSVFGATTDHAPLKIWVLYLMIMTLQHYDFCVSELPDEWDNFRANPMVKYVLEFKVQGLWYSQFWQLKMCSLCSTRCALCESSHDICARCTNGKKRSLKPLQSSGTCSVLRFNSFESCLTSPNDFSLDLRLSAFGYAIG
jgi:hypothetical protein